MSTKSLVWLLMFIGSAAGSYLPVLWGGSLFSFTSIILSAVGGIIGIVAGIMIGSSLND